MTTTVRGDPEKRTWADITLRQAALIAASGLLVMSVLSPLAFFYIFPKLVVRTNIVQTAQNITAHQGLFLAGILCYLVTFVGDILVAWALFVFLRPVNASLSLLASWFRVAYASMALVTLLKLVTVLRLLRSAEYAAAFGLNQLHVQVELLLSSFRQEWSFSLIIFAVHLGLLSALVYRSRYVPKVLGVFLAINSLGYFIDTLRPYLFPTTNLPFLFIAFFGELIFIVWLFFSGSKIQDA
jgi:hypothetical protein